LFQKTKIGEKTTSAFQKKFDDGSLEISKMAFNVSNILEILAVFFENRAEIMQDCITDVFDKCTKYHAGNTVHSEGWKSNRTSKIADRIVIPHLQLTDKWGWTSIYRSGRFGTFADDFDKVLCWITGINKGDPRFKSLFSTVDKQMDLLRAAKWTREIEVDYRDELTSTFFKIRIFKKGTIHLTFRDTKIRDMFNKAAAEGSKAIGADY
jgi:hypothetical protein